MDGQIGPRVPLERLLSSAVPAPVYAAWEAPAPVPAAGQLWRARWEQWACAVLVLRATISTVTAAPVTLDAAAADATAVILAEESSTIGVPAAVWLELTADLPIRVLDRPLGVLTGTIDVADLRGSLGRLRRGPMLHTPADPRALAQAHIADAFEAFSDASWLPEQRGGLSTLLEPLDFETLAGLLGDPKAALAVRRGKQPITAAQANAIAAVLGRDPDELLAANPSLPDDLVRVFDQPDIRRNVTALAGRRRVPERQQRLESAYGVYAMAARQPGGQAPDWAARARQYFAAHLGDEG